MTTNSSAALLEYIIHQANSGQKNWFSHQQQRIAGIHLAYEIAKNHADTMTPEEVADYTVALNNEIYKKIVVKGD
jgi:predicted ATPase